MKPSAAKESFRRKVELLESWAVGGNVPPGEYCPRGPAELARWADMSRGLVAWSNPNLAAPAPSGHYPDLRARFDAAIAKLLKTERQPNNELQLLKREVQVLAEQVAVLTSEHRLMGESLKRERQLKEIAQAQLAEARAELLRIVPLR
jgi:hypothetical protein